MNRFYLLLILSAGFVFSCKKQSQSPPPPDQVHDISVKGIWELRNVSGGWIPIDSIDRSPGNGNLWKFTQTEFARVYEDSVYRSGTYSISQGTGTDLNTERKIDQFVFNNAPAESFELIHDTLKVYYGWIPADGDIEMFVKIAESQ